MRTHDHGPAPHPSNNTVHEVAYADWDDVVTRLGGDDIYFRRGWNETAAMLEPGHARAVLLEQITDAGEIALPLLVRDMPTGAGHDAAGAYPFGGPIAIGDPDPVDFGTELDTWARSHGVVTTYLHFHPLYANQRWCPASAVPTWTQKTKLWDTSPGRDLAAAMHPHHRRAARKAERAGVEIRITDPETDLTRFRALYDQTMERHHATAFYRFGEAYWASLKRTAAGGRLVLVEGWYAGELVTALLCVVHGHWLHYLHGGSAETARHVWASNLAFLTAAQWAQEHGVTGFHLGRGSDSSTENPLLVFKDRFDPASEQHDFFTAKVVHDPQRYRELTGSDSIDGFFPPWRAH